MSHVAAHVAKPLSSALHITKRGKRFATCPQCCCVVIVEGLTQATCNHCDTTFSLVASKPKRRRASRKVPEVPA